MRTECRTSTPRAIFLTVFGVRGQTCPGRNPGNDHLEIGGEESHVLAPAAKCIVCSYTHNPDDVANYRGNSLTTKCTPLGPYPRPMPRDLGGGQGGGRFLMGEVPHVSVIKLQ